MKTSSITREVGITVALKFENCNFDVTAEKKINEFMSDFLFYYYFNCLNRLLLYRVLGKCSAKL
jgi:hypothetical protein